MQNCVCNVYAEWYDSVGDFVEGVVSSKMTRPKYKVVYCNKCQHIHYVLCWNNTVGDWVLVG